MISDQLPERELGAQAVGCRHGDHCHPGLARFLEGQDRRRVGGRVAAARGEQFGVVQRQRRVARDDREVAEHAQVWHRSSSCHATQASCGRAPNAS